MTEIGTVAAEYERNGIDNTLGVSVSIPLRLFDRNQGEKERTRYELTSSQFAVTAAQNQVISDVDQAYLALETALVQSRRYRDHYLGEAERVRDNLQFSYRNGNSTLLDYLDALRDYRSIRLNSVNADASRSAHAYSCASSSGHPPSAGRNVECAPRGDALV